MAAIQHMVLLKFKPEVSEEQIEELFQDIGALKQRLPGITHYGGGPYSSPEGFNKGFTHGFLMTFESAAARDAYLPHPEHEAVKDAILPLVDDAIAFDFDEASGTK